MAGAQIIAGATNLPVDRALRKIDNVQNALSEDAEMWQRVALLSGWQDWEIGMKEKKKEKPKGRTKVIREKINRERVKREKVKREKNKLNYEHNNNYIKHFHCIIPFIKFLFNIIIYW